MIKSSGESYMDKIHSLMFQIKEQDSRLHKQENFTKSLLNSMDDLVFVLNRQGRFVGGYGNPKKQNLYLVPEEDFVGKHHNEVMPQRMHEQFNEALKAIEDTCSPQQYEYFLDLPDGRFWFEARLSPLRNTVTDFAGVVAVVRNITDRKQRELALQKAAEAIKTEKAKLEVVTESIGAGLIIISRDYKVVWANKVMKQQFRGLVGKSCKDLHSGSDSPCSDEFCPAAQIFERGEERAIARMSNNSEWDTVVATPLRDPEDEEVAAVLELITFKTVGGADVER